MTIYSGILALLFCCVVLLGLKKDLTHRNFMSVYETRCIKGICAFSVVLCHIYAYYKQGIALKIFNKIAFIPVALFFLFTGYGLIISAENKKNYLNGFLTNRLGKLYIPLWCSLLINGILRFILNSKREISLLTIIRDVLGLNSIWFFFVIIIYYIVFFLIWKITNGKRAVTYLIVFTIMQCLVCSLLNMGKQYYTSSFGFVIGMILAREKNTNYFNLKRLVKRFTYTKFNWAFIVATVTMSVIAYFRYHNQIFVGQLVLRNLLGIFLVSIFLIFLYYYKIGNHFSSKLGKYSYEIFLLHPTVIIAVRTGRLCTLSPSCQVAIILLITFIEAVILHHLTRYILNFKRGIG